MFSPNPSISIGAKGEISPKGFTLGVMAERGKKKFQSARKLLINSELYGLVLLAPRLKKFVGQFAT